MRAFLAFLLTLFGVGAVMLYSSAFIVHQNEQALVLRFGEPKQVITEPGLKWKVPFIDTVDIFDKRILDLDTSAQEVTAADQQRLIAISMSPKFGQSWLIQSPIPVLHAGKSWQPFPQPVTLAALPLDQLIPLGQPLSACNSAQGIPIPARMASQQCIAPHFVA